MPSIDANLNMSSPTSNNNLLSSNRKHSLEEDEFSINITSPSSIDSDSEYESEKFYKRNKRSRNEHYSNIYEENKDNYQDYDNSTAKSRFKRQALNIDKVSNKVSNINDLSSNRHNVDSNLNKNNQKNSLNKNIINYTKDQLNNDNNYKNDIKKYSNVSQKNSLNKNIINYTKDQLNNDNNYKNDIKKYSNVSQNSDIKFSNENDNIINKLNKIRLNKKKFNLNNGSEKSRFWNTRNSSNPLMRTYHGNFRQGTNISIPSSNLKSNNSLINNGNPINNNTPKNNISCYSHNNNKNAFVLLKKHENKISKKKKKTISEFASINQTNLSVPNAKKTMIHSMKIERKLKKLEITTKIGNKSINSSSLPLMHPKIYPSGNVKPNTTKICLNNTNINIPLDSTISIRAIITTKEAGVIIGREGKNVSRIREESGAKVMVSEHIPGIFDRIITVVGDIDTVSKAFHLVSERIVIEFEKERQGLISIPEYNNSNSMNNNTDNVNHKEIEINDNTKNLESFKKITSFSENQRKNETSETSNDSCTNMKNDHDSEDQIMDTSMTINDNDDDKNDRSFSNEEQNNQPINDNSYSLSESVLDDHTQTPSEDLNYDDLIKTIDNYENDGQSNDGSYYSDDRTMSNDVNTTSYDNQYEIELDHVEPQNNINNITTNDSVNKNSNNLGVTEHVKDIECKTTTKNEVLDKDSIELKELLNRERISLRILIPDIRVGSIIGKSGSKIKEIQEKSNASIIASEENLPNSTERTIIINGTVQAIRLAIYNIGIILRDNYDQNLNVIYYKPMPVSYFQNTLSSPSYAMPYSSQNIPPNFGNTPTPYPLPFFLNSPTTPTPPPSNLPFPHIQSFPPPLPPPVPPHIHSQFNPEMTHHKIFHKNFKNNNNNNNNNFNNRVNSNNNNSSDNKINNNGSNNKINNNNNNNKLTKGHNNNILTKGTNTNNNNDNNKSAKGNSNNNNNNNNNINISNKSTKENNNSNNKLIKENNNNNKLTKESNNNNKIENIKTNSAPNTPTTTNVKSKLNYSRTNSNNNNSSKSNYHHFINHNDHSNPHHSFINDASNPSSHPLIHSSISSIPPKAINFTSSPPPAILQNMDMGICMEPPTCSISNYSMRVGLINITNSPQHFLPPSQLNDFTVFSPPLTPPPASFNGNGNVGIPSNSNMPYMYKRNRMNSTKGNNSSFNSNNTYSLPNVYQFNSMSKRHGFNPVNNSPTNPSHSLPPPHQIIPPYNNIHIQQLYVPNKLIGCVIGKQGDCIKHIRNVSGSQIKIAEPNPNNTERLITITGNTETNHVAMHMILDRLENERNKLLKHQQQQKQKQQSSPS